MTHSEAWAICDETNLDDHEDDCAYRESEGAILCDCEVLMKQDLE